MTTDTLRPPVLPERRIGWWFMRTFRPWEVARRTARNELLEAAWKVNTEAFVDDAQHRRLFAAVDALNAVEDRRSRFGRLGDFYPLFNYDRTTDEWGDVEIGFGCHDCDHHWFFPLDARATNPRGESSKGDE